MASNLSTIGFAFANGEDFHAAMTRLAAEAVETLSTGAGDYAIWRSRTGAEIWFHLSPKTTPEPEVREILGLTPFFEGRSDVPVEITRAVRRSGDSAFEGAFTAWVAPDEAGSGAYPIVFDAIDFAAHAVRPPPFKTRVRITAFTRELKAFASDEAYQAAQTETAKFVSPCFFPVGMLAAAAESDGEAGKPPSSQALLTGRVAEHRLLVNEATGESFHWLLVEGLDATFDVLADPDVVTGDIVDGGTVEVAALLFGRILD